MMRAVVGAVEPSLATPPRSQPPPVAKQRRLAPLRRGAAVASVLQVTGVVCRYGSQLALARWAGPAAFGEWTYATNLGQLAATPADGGLATAVTRFIPEAVATGDVQHQAKLIRASRAITLVAGALLAAVTIGVVALAGGSIAPMTVLLIGLAVTPLYGLIEVQTGLCRSYERVNAAYLPPLVLQPLTVLAIVGVVAATGHTSATALVTATAAAVLLVVAVQARSLSRLRPRVRRQPIDKQDIRTWRGVSLPLLTLSLSNLVFSRVDLLLVGVFLGAADAGVYSVAFRTAAVATLVQTGISAVLTPRLARLHWSGERRQLEETLLSGTRWIVLASAAVSLPLVLLGPEILGLFGPSFRAGAAALTVYLIGQFVGVCAGPVGWLLAISGEHRRAAGIGVAGAGIALIGYLVLIPAFGLIGAAAANSLGMVVRNLWSNFAVRRRLGYRVDPIRALRPGRSEEDT